jgi:hypothetical protein
MNAWMSWAGRAGSGIVDMGSPVAAAARLIGPSRIEGWADGSLEELSALHIARRIDRGVRVPSDARDVIRGACAPEHRDPRAAVAPTKLNPRPRAQDATAYTTWPVAVPPAGANLCRRRRALASRRLAPPHRGCRSGLSRCPAASSARASVQG